MYISRLYADLSFGEIKNLDDFCRLAKEYYDEAYRLFYSSNFKNLIREDKDRILYEGLRMQPQAALIVETFLTASHPVSYTHLDVYKRQVCRYG